MRPIDSAYDRTTAEYRSDDPGRTKYALISNHNGPCSIIGDYASLSDAIEAARAMDTDAASTDLESEIGYDGTQDNDDAGLIAAAQAAGWRVVASAPAGEYWTVLVHDHVHCECGEITGERCEWSGPIAETVIVEYMPVYLRASHVAAGNSGRYPHNGARRIRVESSCADRVTHVWIDGEQTDDLDEWVSVVGE